MLKSRIIQGVSRKNLRNFKGVFFASLLWITYVFIGQYEQKYNMEFSKILAEQSKHPFKTETNSQRFQGVKVLADKL